jgi:glycosyltransferase involved in cell wall biosynthesis
MGEVESKEMSSSAEKKVAGKPVFGFLLFGGPLSGAMVRDIRLANELVARGFEVHVWWAMDKPEPSKLDPTITQRWLFPASRYMPVKLLGMELGNWRRGHMERIGHFLNWWFPYSKRTRGLQKRPHRLDELMVGMLKVICLGVEGDMPVVNRFAAQLTQSGVTHMLPMLSVLCPWVAAARRQMSGEAAKKLKYLVTFQGYELYVNYARGCGLEEQMYEQLRGAVADSDWPAIAVSEDYRNRVHEDVGIAMEQMVAIPPGIPLPESVDRAGAGAHLKAYFNEYKADVPLITYVGRRDSEKGIDLLLYAATLLRQRGAEFQLAICGPTLFGSQYGQVCAQIAQNLRCPVHWAKRVPDEVLAALYSGSHCIVYPSIHREPFGMVAAETMSYGTPAVVPDYGGVAGVVEIDGLRGGIKFDVWDSGSLADALQKLLDDRDLWQELCHNGPKIAEYFSVPRLADRVMDHLGLATQADESLKSEIAHGR